MPGSTIYILHKKKVEASGKKGELLSFHMNYLLDVIGFEFVCFEDLPKTIENNEKKNSALTLNSPNPKVNYENDSDCNVLSCRFSRKLAMKCAVLFAKKYYTTATQQSLVSIM